MKKVLAAIAILAVLAVGLTACTGNLTVEPVAEAPVAVETVVEEPTVEAEVETEVVAEIEAVEEAAN